MTARTRLDLAILLPQAPDHADNCVVRLLTELRGRDGIEQAHVVPAQGTVPAKLCLHYDPQIISLGQIRDMAEQTGAKLSTRYGHLLWPVQGIGHQRRARTVADQLLQMPGIIEAEATAAETLRIEFDRQSITEGAIREALARLSVTVLGSGSSAAKEVGDLRESTQRLSGGSPADQRHAAESGRAEPADEHHVHGSAFGANAELMFALSSGALLGLGYLLSWTDAAPVSASTGLYLAAYFFGGFYTLREAVDSLRLRRFEIDTLMLVAALGAAALGRFAEGALLLFLFSLGHALEHFAMGRAKRAIQALATLAPRSATVRRGATVQKVPIERLTVGDTVLVKPNERLPADGFVIEGSSAVNQAPVTGESMPVDKQPVTDAAAAAAAPDRVARESRVFAGTLNGPGFLAVKVTRLSADTTLAKLVRLVSEAETQKSPTQRFTDRFERMFVPAVLSLAFMLLLAGTVVDEPFRDTFYRAMAVLVAASPCALAIATPSAVLSGVARAARGGVLVKGGGPLEHLGALSAIAFDKTGTLTEGKPQVTDVVPAPGATRQELLATATSVEALSDHPLAAAIVDFGVAELGAPTEPASGLRAITGRGVEARLAGEIVHIGRDELFSEVVGAAVPDDIDRAAKRLRESGRTIMIVRRGERYLGTIGLMDTPRAAARRATERLRKLGIRRMIMLSGDHQRVAEAIAAQVGIGEAVGDLMPEDKVRFIRELKAQEQVAMVGDGVNDAPALANATVGIAMGAAASDVALETADVALMADNLSHLPFAVALSRRTRRIIRQNVWVSLGVVAMLVPATIAGLGIGPAVMAHEGSTLIVVFNALRLLAFRDQPVDGGPTPLPELGEGSEA